MMRHFGNGRREIAGTPSRQAWRRRLPFAPWKDRSFYRWPLGYGWGTVITMATGTMQEWLANNWISILLGAIGALLVWFITNWVGKPIVDIRDKRIKALQAAEQNANVGFSAGDKRVTEARAALSEAASGLRSISRGHGLPVRLYCWFEGYDLEAAADWLITLHNWTGEIGQGDKARQIVVDAIHILLRAHKHLSQERIDEIKMRIGLEKRLSEEKL